MPPLRILHVTPYYEDAWAYGGIPRVAAATVRALARRGHHVTVCTTDVRDASSRLPRPAAVGHRRGPWEAVSDEIRTWVFPNLSNTLAYHFQFFTPLGFAAWLRRNAGAFDVAHLHACHHLPGVQAARRLRAAGVPYVLGPNGTAPRLERRRAAKAVFDATVGRHVLPDAARVLATSAAEGEQLRELGVDDDRIRLVPNPVDLNEFDPPVPRGRFRARHGLGERPIALFLGKLTPRKRLDVLVSAFALLAHPGARLVIAGNDMGGGRTARRLVARLGLDQSTLFTGLLQGRERLEALADADVVVYPGRDEIFGLVAVEAVLCGTPVIVADDSGCGEIVARVGGGLVVPQGDAAAIARAMREVLEEPHTRRGDLADAGDRIRAWLDAGVVATILEDVYREVIATRRATWS